MMIDCVGQLWTVMEPLLVAAGCPYQLHITHPMRSVFVLDDHSLYVIKQHEDVAGKLHVTVAAKMGKEVF